MMGCGFWLGSAANKERLSPIIFEKYSCVSVSLQPSMTVQHFDHAHTAVVENQPGSRLTLPTYIGGFLCL